MRRWAELVGAACLLTRLPVGGWTAVHPPQAACLWAYPVVGAVVGLAGAAVLTAALAVGLSQPLATLWAIAATVVLTGGLHEDGLADTADGLGGGRDAAHKLAIMRDSRIGSYGTLALAGSLAIRGVAIATSQHPVQMIVLAAVLGRGAMLINLVLFKPARADGIAATLRGPAQFSAYAGLAITGAAVLWSLTAILAAGTAALVMGVLASRQVGGYTGDTLGACEQAAECAALSVAG